MNHHLPSSFCTAISPLPITSQLKEICPFRSRREMLAARIEGKKFVGLENLPDEILIEIFLRLPTESVYSIQCVCKMLSQLVDNHLFTILHKLSAVAATAEVPRFMIAIQSDLPDPTELWKPNSNTLQLLKYDATTSSFTLGDVSNSISIFNWGDFQVCCVFRNLFCFVHQYFSPKRRDSKEHQSCFVFNPLAPNGGEVVMVPQHYKPFQWYGMGMGFDDKTKTLKIKIVGISIFDESGSYVYELGTSNTSWRQISSVPPYSICLSHMMGVSAFGNMYYWLKPRPGNAFYIVSFDFSKEEFSQISHPELHAERHFKLHLVNLRGSLAAVNTITPSNNIEIWVLPGPNKEWTLDYKIQRDVCLTGPDRGILRHCGEWDHGLFFVEYHTHRGVTRSNAILLDLRCGGSTKRVFFPDKFQDGRRHCDWASRLLSFTGSMISLKQCGNFLEAKADGWHIDFKDAKGQVALFG